ncbi:MAG: hypothetical protein JWQ98_735 [Chlorobi bacterium]|nr:hypothetical protein [Chlorobiota bacterium]
MNGAHIHLILNHIPVVGILFCTALLVVAMMRKSADVRRVALWSFVVVAAITIPAYLTGDPAQETLRGVSGVMRGAIHAHEEMAFISMIGAEIAGILAIFGLVMMRKPEGPPAWLMAVLLLLSLAVCVLMAITSTRGGEIRHPEIGSDWTAPAGPRGRPGGDSTGGPGRP